MSVKCRLKKDTDNGGGYACVEAGDIWDISVPSYQICCEPKTTLKKVLFFFFNWGLYFVCFGFLNVIFIFF